MSADYINDFNKPDPDNSAFAPQKNTYELPSSTATTPGPHSSVKPFGDMLPGMSVQGPTGTTVPTLVLPTKNPPGILLQLSPNSNDKHPDSRPVYITNLKLNSSFFLPTDSRLTAEIRFDLPKGSDVPGQTDCHASDHKWALGLVLKSGDENEYLGEQSIGVTCQFFNGGSINFHKTDYNSGNAGCSQQVPYNKTYAEYQNEGTVFAMSLSIWRQGTAVVGKGALNLIPSSDQNGPPIEASGNLTIPQDPTTMAPYTQIDWVNALGVSLVCAKNDLDSVSVRLRRFTVSVDPLTP